MRPRCARLGRDLRRHDVSLADLLYPLALFRHHGRGEIQGTCILLFKEGLSKNAIKRINILKNSDDGFFIAEEDLKLRGFGDLIGYQQSGIKSFRFADPVIHEDLFRLAEKYVQDNQEYINEKKYHFLLKLFDRAEIINIK